MTRIPYFPLRLDRYEIAMDAAILKPDRLIEIDERYAEEIALKRDILASDHDAYFLALPGSERMQREVTRLLMENLVRHHPDHSAFREAGERRIWENRLLGSIDEFDTNDIDSVDSPLDWIGRQVQEDLTLLEEREDGEIRLIAGQLCFGSAWSLEEKIGSSFPEIHRNVPGFAESVAIPGGRMLRNLKPGRPTYRVNWSVSPSDRLNLSPKTASEWLPSRRTITSENAGERCHLRLERQTFSRLPETRGILFTIHTYLIPMNAVAREPDKRRRLLSNLKTMPEATIRYKGMTDYLEPLLTYLECEPR